MRYILATLLVVFTLLIPGIAGNTVTQQGTSTAAGSGSGSITQEAHNDASVYGDGNIVIQDKTLTATLDGLGYIYQSVDNDAYVGTAITKAYNNYVKQYGEQTCTFSNEEYDLSYGDSYIEQKVTNSVNIVGDDNYIVQKSDRYATHSAWGGYISQTLENIAEIYGASNLVSQTNVANANNEPDDYPINPNEFAVIIQSESNIAYLGSLTSSANNNKLDQYNDASATIETGLCGLIDQDLSNMAYQEGDYNEMYQGSDDEGNTAEAIIGTSAEAMALELVFNEIDQTQSNFGAQTGGSEADPNKMYQGNTLEGYIYDVNDNLIDQDQSNTGYQDGINNIMDQGSNYARAEIDVGNYNEIVQDQNSIGYQKNNDVGQDAMNYLTQGNLADGYIDNSGDDMFFESDPANNIAQYQDNFAYQSGSSQDWTEINDADADITNSLRTTVVQDQDNCEIDTESGSQEGGSNKVTESNIAIADLRYLYYENEGDRSIVRQDQDNLVFQYETDNLMEQDNWAEAYIWGDTCWQPVGDVIDQIQSNSGLQEGDGDLDQDNKALAEMRYLYNPDDESYYSTGSYLKSYQEQTNFAEERVPAFETWVQANDGHSLLNGDGLDIDHPDSASQTASNEAHIFESKVIWQLNTQSAVTDPGPVDGDLMTIGEEDPITQTASNLATLIDVVDLEQSNDQVAEQPEYSDRTDTQTSENRYNV
ncbi:MAG: hypothetical protein HPY61_11120 [Methanotrichaceae archaeon]|nr:hypothetical protein [Methanotrichaceae archaeon]